ncbi:MAG: hypothetical protein ACM3U0_01870 [archaeon]
MQNYTTIYVRFIDGVNVKIPVQAEQVSDDIYQLLPNEEFEYENSTCLFEFGPGDIVRVMKDKDSANSDLLAYSLIKQGDKRNALTKLLFHIMHDNLSFEDVQNRFSTDDIKNLLPLKDKGNSIYPQIRVFVENNYLEIQGLMK